MFSMFCIFFPVVSKMVTNIDIFQGIRNSCIVTTHKLTGTLGSKGTQERVSPLPVCLSV